MQYVKINNPLVELGDLHNGDIEESEEKKSGCYVWQRIGVKNGYLWLLRRLESCHLGVKSNLLVRESSCLRRPGIYRVRSGETERYFSGRRGIKCERILS